MLERQKEWLNVCLKYRDKSIDTSGEQNKYRLANFSGTAQGKDIEKRTAVIGDFYRTKINCKGFSSDEKERRGIPQTDMSDNAQIFATLANEFDMPYWAFHSLQDKKPLQDYIKTFIWQLNTCNVHCPWCYVDDINKAGRTDNNSEFFGMKEIIDAFEEQRKNNLIYNMRPSGGEPTLCIEQWLEALQELEKRGLSNEVYMQGDTNQTTLGLIKHLEQTEQLPKDFLKKVGEYQNFGLLCSFKGTDKKSFLRATGLPEKYFQLEEERFEMFNEFLKSGIDAFPFIYDAHPKSLISFMERGSRQWGDEFLLKTWLFPLKFYGPEKERLEKRGISPEQEQQRLDENFKINKEIMQDLIWRRFGVNYQAIPRAGIKIKPF